MTPRRLLLALALLLMTALAQADTHVTWTRAALERLPVASADRSPARLELRSQQLDQFAREIAKVSASAPLPPSQWASLLGSIGAGESNFDTDVVAGRCKAFQCDPIVKKGVRTFQSVGAFQQQNVAYLRDLWPTAADNIAAQVEMADRTLRRSLRRCQPFAAFPQHVYRAYGGGSCSFPAGREAVKVAAYVRMMATPRQSGGSS